eukprot:TRINITY_DN14445_c0_g1_i1.p1 TRINITY_DN14445_c0_g1~~TRINITY_DN14445_c0_g1_i1.p1  ORF type:complete len:371 (-),score=92.91 TRINITY_DN14445_c0_g1_i1:250-1362(-)
MALSDTTWGWLAVVASVLCFGSFGVPIKTKKVLEAKVDPIVFQSYKTFWVLVTSFISFTYNEFSYTPLGLVSGAFWVPAGCCFVLATNCIGLGVTQGLQNSLVIIVSFIWGTLIFREPTKNLGGAFGAIAMLMVGVVGMALAPSLFYKATPPPRPSSGDELERAVKNGGQGDHHDDHHEAPAVHHETHLITTTDFRGNVVSPDTHLQIGKRWIPKKPLGYAAAIFGGTWGGSIYAPLKIANKYGLKAGGISYVFSFGVGAVVVNSLMLTCYMLYVHYVTKKPLPGPQLRVMWLPGSLCGLLWSAGNYLSIYAIALLGYGTAYPAIQSNLIIGGLWAVALYRELKPKQIILWFCSAALAAGAIGLLAQMTG